ncbi:MAG TPA: VOC family protein [Euzebyales bacterium]
MAHPDMVPLIITDALDVVRAFYVDRLGATTTIEMDTYVQLRFGDIEHTRELAFMAPDQPGGPLAGQPTFAGGLVVSVSVDDADKYQEVLVGRGVDAPEPTDKPWGWRSFTVTDPAGVVVDFFHEIANTAAKDAQS